MIKNSQDTFFPTDFGVSPWDYYPVSRTLVNISFSFLRLYLPTNLLRLLFTNFPPQPPNFQLTARATPKFNRRNQRASINEKWPTKEKKINELSSLV